MIGLKPETETEFLMVVNYLDWYRMRNDKIKETNISEYYGFTFADLFKHKYGRSIEEVHEERSALIAPRPEVKNRFGRVKSKS